MEMPLSFLFVFNFIIIIIIIIYYMFLVGEFPRPDQISKFSVDRRSQYQEILGIGGSFTDAAGLNIGSLSYGAQENLMK